MSEGFASAPARERIPNDGPKSGGAATGLGTLIRSLAGYREPHHGRSVIEILITLVPFVLL
jgi:hypothetical protein